SINTLLYLSSSLFFLSMIPRHSTSPLFPYTTLFRSSRLLVPGNHSLVTDLSHRSLLGHSGGLFNGVKERLLQELLLLAFDSLVRSEEHTSELHHVSISYAVFCLKKKNTVIFI